MDIAITSTPCVKIVRYADDFVIMCKSKIISEFMMVKVKSVLKQLKLQLHKEKTKIVNARKDQFEFLGFIFGIKQGKHNIKPKDKSIKKFKDLVRIVTKRKSPIKSEQMVGILNWTIRGLGNYFKIGDTKILFKQLDVWIRMKVRCFIEKKKSRYAHQRLPNYVLQSKYKLASLCTLIKPRSL
jgi:predicted nucleic acid binding AN1-type Zn finger protein